jgi:hypothetical protein
VSTVFVFKAIKPKKLKVDEIRLEILNALRAEGRDQRQELEKTTQTWKREKPKFESLIGLERPPGGASVLTGPTGSDKAVNKWTWLNEGTKIRWALMSRDWRSKTTVGKFSSGPGRGGVVIAGRRAMTARNIRPRPGIKARNWTTILQKRRRRPFTRRMIKAIQRGAAKVF